MIPSENYHKKEVHFMVIESEVDKFGLTFKEVIKKVKDRIQGNRVMSFDEWTIVDFDDCLKGNPHIQFDADDYSKNE